MGDMSLSDTKLCVKCDIPKLVSEFHNDKRRKDGLASYCKVCIREYGAEWRKKNPDRQRRNLLKLRYGISLEEYEALLEAQGGCCDLCGRTPEENGQALSVDHDHSCCPNRRACGKCVRSLLCIKCNYRVGLVEGDYDTFLRTLEYLDKHSKTDPSIAA